MDYFKRVIYDDDWTFYLSAEGDNVIIDEGSEAETDFEKKEIYFRKSDLKLTTVTHEIYHLYYAYTFTNTAELNNVQMEEVAAELFSYRAENILKLSKDVYSELLKLKDGK